jgi:hypothetical protein
LKGPLHLTSLIVNLCASISWFEGDFNKDETEEILQGHPIGTFLVRFSTTQVGAFAISFVGVNERVSHSLVEHDGVIGMLK